MTVETVTNPPESVASQTAGTEGLLAAAAFAILPDVAWIRITGEDRTRWLNGMVTNSITSLGQGETCYNFFLNAQGRIQGDATAVNLGESIELVTSASRADALIAMLDHFIIMDDVELQKLPEDRQALLVAGPGASSLLRKIGINVDGLACLHVASFDWRAGDRLEIFHANSPIVPRFEIWSSLGTLGRISAELLKAGGLQTSEDALHELRILEGTPLYGADIRDRDLPQETAQARALHFAKGCYLGQEIVERIRSRGNVHRTFMGFTLTGPLPAPGTPLFAADAPEKPVGEMTSAARISLATGIVTLALGYMRREVLDRGIQLTYEGGDAVPTTLPYEP